MKKIAIIFPKYNSQDSSHYPYWYKLFEEVGKNLDIFILFESGQKANFKNCKSFTQNIQNKPFNLIERLFWILKLRFLGYEDFYIHYSTYSLFLSKFTTTIFGGKAYLWDCEFYDQKPTNKLQILAIKLADFLVTGHEIIAKQYKKILNLPKLKTKIVSNWVIENQIKNKINTTKIGTINILFLHHLSERKGSKLLPIIIDKVLNKTNNIKFTIIGDGPDFYILKNWISSNKLQSKVILKKSIPQSEIGKEFQKANIFILPSLSEGFPRVILESQKYEVPYVAFDVGCIKEISPTNYLYIIKMKNISKFSEKVIELSNLSKKDYQIITKKLSKNINTYSLNKSINEFNNIF